MYHRVVIRDLRDGDGVRGNSKWGRLRVRYASRRIGHADPAVGANPFFKRFRPADK